MTEPHAQERAPMTAFPELVAEANRTARAYDETADVVSLLDGAESLHWARPALRTPAGSALTHGELADASRQMAAALARSGVRRGAPVGLLIDHRPESVAALIAVVRAGAYYVPLDPRWPDRRIAEVMTALEVTTLISAPAFDRRVFELATGAAGLERVFRISGESGAAAEVSADGAARRLAEIAEVWDSLTGSDDPCVAAGFNLDGARHRFTLDEVGQYAAHVAGLARERYWPGTAVAEIGAGSGLVTAELARWASRVVATDVSPAAMARLAERAAALALPVTALACPAHEAAGQVRVAAPSVVVLASVIQYFPDIGYLRSVLDGLIGALPPGATVVVADVVDPESGQVPGGLRVPPAWWPDYAAGYLGAGIDVRLRQAGALAGTLDERYDVLLTTPPRLPAVTPAPRRGSPEAPLPLDPAPPPLGPALPRADGAGPARDLPARPWDLAYTITTSGSTGTPKAVAVSHRSVVNLVDWFNRRNGICPDDIMLQVASFTFDLSVYDVFGVLAAGGSLMLAPDEDLGEPGRLLDIVDGHQVTLWNSAPAAFTAVLAFAGPAPSRRPSMRRVFLSGDWVPLGTFAEVARAFPGATLVALGGATEACVWSNDHVVHRVEPEWRSVPYGLPMQNARYYVLRDDGSPCDLDEPGDLYIAGDCVAVGYLNDAPLTAERFLPDPWPARPGERMYRTGDRARWTSHGWVEFLGRLDHQVKIRGYRIELGEVEHAASRMPGVAEAIALRIGQAGPAGEAELGLVVRAEAQITEDAVRDHLRRALPDYMQPSRIRVVRSLPVSGTGKVDRMALAALLAASGPARRVRVLAAGSGISS